MRPYKTASALSIVALGSVFATVAMADVTIPYNEYSESPTIGREVSAAQAEFTAVSTALAKYAAGIDATQFAPGRFPARTGLALGADCTLVR